jgi:hypothetical protein
MVSDTCIDLQIDGRCNLAPQPLQALQRRLPLRKI